MTRDKTTEAPEDGAVVFLLTFMFRACWLVVVATIAAFRSPPEGFTRIELLRRLLKAAPESYGIEVLDVLTEPRTLERLSRSLDGELSAIVIEAISALGIVLEHGTPEERLRALDNVTGIAEELHGCTAARIGPLLENENEDIRQAAAAAREALAAPPPPKPPEKAKPKPPQLSDARAKLEEIAIFIGSPDRESTVRDQARLLAATIELGELLPLMLTLIQGLEQLAERPALDEGTRAAALAARFVLDQDQEHASGCYGVFIERRTTTKSIRKALGAWSRVLVESEDNEARVQAATNLRGVCGAMVAALQAIGLSANGSAAGQIAQGALEEMRSAAGSSS